MSTRAGALERVVVDNGGVFDSVEERLAVQREKKKSRM